MVPRWVYLFFAFVSFALWSGLLMVGFFRQDRSVLFSFVVCSCVLYDIPMYDSRFFIGGLIDV
jgi:hypothetical protein